MTNRPKVGVGIFIIKDGKVLLGKRKNAHGDGAWCFPGGHLEFNESFEGCARRETLEETGLAIKNIRFGTATNDIFAKENKHYITICMIAEHDYGEVKNIEPDKCEKWEWFEWDEDKLPYPLFVPQQNLLKQKFNPFQNLPPKTTSDNLVNAKDLTSNFMNETCYRPSWDDYFMAIARIVATRSTCDRLRAGAVLVKNNRIISTGYNGSPPGLPHCDGQNGHLMEEGHCVRTIHGEHNVILQAAVIPGASTEDSTLYTVYSPCIHCAKYLVAAGVKRIVLGKVYRNRDVIDYLKNAGLEVVVYIEDGRWNKHVQELFNNEITEMKEKTVSLRPEN